MPRRRRDKDSRFGRLHRVRRRSLLFLSRGKRKNRPDARAARADIKAVELICKKRCQTHRFSLGKLRFLYVDTDCEQWILAIQRHADTVSKGDRATVQSNQRPDYYRNRFGNTWPAGWR